MTARPVRVAVVGAGWWSTDHHVPALLGHPDAEVVAVCDPVPDRAQRLAAQAGALAAANLDDALACTQVDAVVISTPHVTHHALVGAALDAGLDVLVEKPLALTADHAFDLVERAERLGRHLVTGYTHQLDAGAGAARSAVRAEIGDLVQVTVEFSSRAGDLFVAAQHGIGSDDRGRHPEAYSAANGGGQAHTQLTHALGMLCWATDEELAQVAAFVGSHGLDVDVDDAAAFRMRGGATGVVVGSGATPSGSPPRQHVRYLGTRGTVEQDLHRARVVVHRADGSQVHHEPGQHTPAYQAGAPARALVDVVLGRTENPAPPRPAAAAVAAVEALLTAAREHRVVDVAPLPPPPGVRPLG
ncbi:Gfo/Idh/MocA family protein [Actinotalea subterranea]|uniref:Gfo/Idh/MocA family protein n=1 Tax=Actinotalea subterranea TaxID=2607497 RepID=UPI0011EBACE2|nr:Gfo/Idh/MocA family oxidoreductase [Actinotalea subterranea]